jgi:hypothetical protein
MEDGRADWLLVASACDLDFVVIVVGFFLLDCKKIVLQIDMVPSNYIVRNRLSITIDSKLNIK